MSDDGGMPVTASSGLLLAALVVALIAFAIQRRGARLVDVSKPLAPPRGSATAGVVYAFTKAFAPTAKESASLHLLGYLAGVAYHLAIFGALAKLLVSLLPVTVPPAVNVAAAALFASGLACGLALLVKRAVDARVRSISVPDDFLANLLVDATLAAALAASLDSGLAPLFQVIGALLLLYAPLGKLRHMLFLLASRGWSGAYFGRRGVRPRPATPGIPRG